MWHVNLTSTVHLKSEHPAANDHTWHGLDTNIFLFALSFPGSHCTEGGRRPRMTSNQLAGVFTALHPLRGIERRRDFTRQPRTPNVHFKIEREDPQRKTKRAKMEREREKKAQDFGPSTIRAPTLFLGPTFSGFGPPPFGAAQIVKPLQY